MRVRIGIFSLNEVLDFVGPVVKKDGISKNGNEFTYSYPSYKKEYLGKKVKMGCHRLVLFKAKGTDCVKCGLKGEFFALEQVRSDNDNAFSFNLYGYDKDGKEVMLTKDHIIPYSKGGKSSLDNYQTMCSPCNSKKGSN